MCLVTFLQKPLIAKENIICYKQFYMCSAESIMLTPVTEYAVAIPKNTPTMMDDTSKPIEIGHLPIGTTYKDMILSKPAYTIGAGMIHAYIDSNSIKNFAYHKKFKCIIPKGTEYYTGLNKDICAKKLLIVEWTI